MRTYNYTVNTGMLSQTPYAGEYYVRCGQKAGDIFVQRYQVKEILIQCEPLITSGMEIRKALIAMFISDTSQIELLLQSYAPCSYLLRVMLCASFCQVA